MLSVLAVLFVLALPTSTDLPDDTPLVPGDGLGLSTNNPRTVTPRRASRSMPSIPLPGPGGLGGFGGMAAVAALAVGRSRTGTGRRREDEDEAADYYDGDLRQILGLAPGEEVIHLMPGHDGRVAVWVGPKDADHVIIFVPGTGADITNTDEYLERARNLREAAANAAEGETVAVVYSLVFDAPDEVFDLSDPFGPDCACSDHKAHTGSVELTKFVAGLDLEDRDVAVLGYSYGATVVGYALRDHGLADYVDRAMFVGAPGVGTKDYVGLHLRKDQVLAAQSRGDEINYAPPNETVVFLPFLGPILGPLAAVKWAEYTDNLTHGVDPTAERFGATVVETRDHGHGEYFESVENLEHIGRAIVGRAP